MINYLNLTEASLKGFDNAINLPFILPSGLTAVFTNASTSSHMNAENLLLIMLGEEYSISSPEIGRSWLMTIPEVMLASLKSLVKAFYEHTYLPFQESKILYSEAQQFRSFFKTVPASMYVKDLKSRFIRVNDHFRKHVGLAPHYDLIGKTDFDIFDKEHANKAFADEQAIIKSGEPKAAYIEQEIHPDGSESWALSTKIPIRDISNKIIGVSGVSFDITKVKESEQNIRSLVNI